MEVLRGLGLTWEKLQRDQPAPRLRHQHRLRARRRGQPPVLRHQRAGADGHHDAPGRAGAAADLPRHGLGRHLRRPDVGARHPAGALQAQSHGRGPAHRRLALRRTALHGRARRCSPSWRVRTSSTRSSSRAQKRATRSGTATRRRTSGSSCASPTPTRTGRSCARASTQPDLLANPRFDSAAERAETQRRTRSRVLDEAISQRERAGVDGALDAHSASPRARSRT